MYCVQCQEQRAQGVFCPECGRPLEELPVVAEAPLLQVEVPTGTSAALVEAGTRTPALATAPLASPLDVSGSHPIAPVNNATNVTVNVAGPQIIYQDKTGHGIGVRALWFVFFGWWVGQIWLATAWLLNLTVIGLPVGLAMINKLPKVMTLKSQQIQLDMTTNADGTYTLTRKHVDQRPFWMRALYFITVGWWASLLWAEVAWFCCLFVVGIPVGFMMFNKLPAVTTLARY